MPIRSMKIKIRCGLIHHYEQKHIHSIKNLNTGKPVIKQLA